MDNEVETLVILVFIDRKQEDLSCQLVGPTGAFDSHGV